MPVFRQSAFVRRAIESLLAQTMGDWELILVDDGSDDGLAACVNRYLDDPRVRVLSSPANQGLGAALNVGLDAAVSSLIAYLPADDVFYRDHLGSLIRTLDANPAAVLAYSGVRHHYNRYAEGPIDGSPLQLVQVMHRKTPHHWMSRAEITTDDLDRMFWNALRRSGASVPTGDITCEWVNHPEQRHKKIVESEGGINPYRQYYTVRQPLRFHSSKGNLIDERRQFEAARSRKYPQDGMKILLVGELAYNPDRILALAERGHQLYGLWMRAPWWYNTVGPVPFGHVRDVPVRRWRSEVARIKPDVIYALLNWQAVPFAHTVLRENPGIPFVWHFKEGPFICLERGTWTQLLDLHTYADACIYCNAEMRDWFQTLLPRSAHGRPTILLDGDLPKREWFEGQFAPKLSEGTEELHTVVPGRPIGLHPSDVVLLAGQRIHLHFYGDFTHGEWRRWIEKTQAMASGYLHLHPHIDPDGWVPELSRYDAGWLHYFESENQGETARMNWDDMNYPARLTTLMAAGLPLLQRDNRGHRVAIQTLVREKKIGLLIEDLSLLGQFLRNREQMRPIQEAVWRHRESFTFDHYANGLTSLFASISPPRSTTRFPS